MKLLTSALLLSLAVVPAPAATITFSGSISGKSVFATADYLFATDVLTITVTNGKADPISVAQAISGIDFSIKGGLGGVLTSAKGELIRIDGTGHYTSSGVSSLDWYRPDASFFTTAVGSSGPDDTILGEPGSGGLYSAANGSIEGNGPHNPFVLHSATLTYKVVGATNTSQLSSFAFYFNTDLQRRDADVRAVRLSGVPESGPLVLTAAGLGLIICGTRCRKSRQSSKS